MTDERLHVMKDPSDEATSAECLTSLTAMELRIQRARVEGGLAGVFLGIVTTDGKTAFIGAGDVEDILDQALEMFLEEAEATDVNVDI